jgi:hypothetical protein
MDVSFWSYPARHDDTPVGRMRGALVSTHLIDQRLEIIADQVLDKVGVGLGEFFKQRLVLFGPRRERWGDFAVPGDMCELKRRVRRLCRGCRALGAPEDRTRHLDHHR